MLADLAGGRRTPREVDEWATPWVVASVPAVEDRAVWVALMTLSGADLEVEPGVLLHGQADFDAWLEEFDRAIG